MSGLGYEWDCELVQIHDAGTDHEDNDIVDHNHATTFKAVKELSLTPAPEGHEWHVVLVRTNDEGRSWAYLNDDGTLPEYFEDAYQHRTTKVPQRFHDEVYRNREVSHLQTDEVVS
jgi:hypothetical protein